jgi:hypothetical protein
MTTKAATTPCAACKTTGGGLGWDGLPRRISGRRWGVDGPICLGCYQQLYRGTRPVAVPPCDLCGTREGRGQRPGSKPSRFRGEAFEISGLICGDCRDDLMNEATDDRAKALGIEGRVGAVRQLKQAKRRNAEPESLSVAELRRVLPTRFGPQAGRDAGRATGG